MLVVIRLLIVLVDNGLSLDLFGDMFIGPENFPLPLSAASLIAIEILVHLCISRCQRPRDRETRNILGGDEMICMFEANEARQRNVQLLHTAAGLSQLALVICLSAHAQFKSCVWLQ